MNTFKRLIKSKVAQNGLWLILLQIFNTIAPLLTLPYITRILSPTDYGNFSIALNWIGYLQIIVEYGFALTGAKKAAMGKSIEELSRIQSVIIYARTLLFSLSMIVLAALCMLPAVNTSQRICMLLLSIMLLSMIYQQTWFFQGISEMKNITMISMISRLISVLLVFLLVHNPDDLYLYCLLYISNNVIVSLLGIFVSHKKYHLKFCHVRFKEAMLEIKDGWYLFISSAMGKIFGSIGITILAFWATTTEVGIYSAINKIPYMITILFTAISQALYPFFCQLFAKSYEEGITAVKKYSKLVMLPFVAMGVVIVALNKPIVNLVCGEEYASMSTLLIPLVAWVLLSILNNFLGVQTLVASGAQKDYSKAFLTSTIFMLIIMCLLGYCWGAYGIAVASMVSEAILTILLFICIMKNKKKYRIAERF